ncbi:MAG: Rrf2 family transcriptional regulator [Spirochaetales bacterium]|uniref:Rrf2 family transcriptional regulator n=1 Tax=Candidatus Thalassospirochaeta sargassi TaxID=3119039 RepID=A0AAJ1MN27_9SPIO|nr:Rrf2 family transcriptional regulator [Spirochaetales bacterium]
MRITTKGRYGLRAVLKLAAQHDRKPLSISTIASEEQISPEFLEQIFYKMKKSGIIKSTRGPGGGFSLVKDLNEISLADILEAVGEPVTLSPCSTEGTKKDCPRADKCEAYGIWQDVSNHLNDYFNSLTLKDMVEKKLI